MDKLYSFYFHSNSIRCFSVIERITPFSFNIDLYKVIHIEEKHNISSISHLLSCFHLCWEQNLAVHLASFPAMGLPALSEPAMVSWTFEPLKFRLCIWEATRNPLIFSLSEQRNELLQARNDRTCEITTAIYSWEINSLIWFNTQNHGMC